MKYEGYITSHGGKIRINNEDNGYLQGFFQEDNDIFAWAQKTISENGFLAAVFDGMGGIECGEIASKIAAKEMLKLDKGDFSKKVDSYIELANKAINSYGNGMGTTYVAVSIENDKYFMSNLGDSRGYLFRNEKLVQLSKDHNMLYELVQCGIMTEEQVRKHPDRNKIYQYLGISGNTGDSILEAYKTEAIDAKHEDILLLCSDGLTDQVNDEFICTILKLPCSLCEKAELLKLYALEQGGSDNITILLIEVF